MSLGFTRKWSAILTIQPTVHRINLALLVLTIAKFTSIARSNQRVGIRNPDQQVQNRRQLGGPYVLTRNIEPGETIVVRGRVRQSHETFSNACIVKVGQERGR